jgi:hypothetical protein
MNVNFKERAAALDDPNSSLQADDAPIIWRDKTDPKLEKAMRTLMKRRATYKKARRPTGWVSISLWGALPSWAVIVIFSEDDFLTLGVLVSAFVTGLVSALFRFNIWPSLAYRRFRRHMRRMRAGKFGFAIMFSIDHEWEVLDAALQAHGLSLIQINDKPYAAPIIVNYLATTILPRARLRALRMEGKEPAMDSPSLGALQARAKDTADRIASRAV